MNKNYIIVLTLFASLSLFAQTGVFKSYHTNGKKSAAISYSDGIYDGTSYWYYPNGNLEEEKTFSNGKLNGWCRTYYESGLMKEEKYVKEGVTDGILKQYYANGALKSVMSYENGKLVKNIEFDYDPYYKAPIEDYRAGNQQQVAQKKTDEYLCDAKICPEPLGGIESIYEKLIYPADAIAYGLEGEVKLLATIDENGNVVSTKIIRGIGLGCDEAAADAVKKTRFLPGQNDSGPITSNVTLGIKFILQDGKPVVAKKSAPIYETDNIPEPEIGIASTPSPNQVSSEPNKENTSYAIAPEVEKKEDTSAYGNTSTNYVSQKDFDCSGVDVCAKPKNGISSVLQNFKIPNRVKQKNIKGNVIVLCVVDEGGKVRNTTVQQGLPEGASIAVEVALLDTKFEPALKDGTPVRSSVVVSVPVDY